MESVNLFQASKDISEKKMQTYIGLFDILVSVKQTKTHEALPMDIQYQLQNCFPLFQGGVYVFPCVT